MKAKKEQELIQNKQEIIVKCAWKILSPDMEI